MAIRVVNEERRELEGLSLATNGAQHYCPVNDSLASGN